MWHLHGNKAIKHFISESEVIAKLLCTAAPNGPRKKKQPWAGCSWTQRNASTATLAWYSGYLPKLLLYTFSEDHNRFTGPPSTLLTGQQVWSSGLNRSAILRTVKDNRGPRGPSEQQIKRAVYFFKPMLVVARREFGFNSSKGNFALAAGASLWPCSQVWAQPSPCAAAVVSQIKKLLPSSPLQCRQTVLQSSGGSHSFTEELEDSTSQANCPPPCLPRWLGSRVLALDYQYTGGGKGFKKHLHSVSRPLAETTHQRYKIHSWYRACS